MDDLQTINSIVEKAVETSSYTTVLLSSAVFICYTLIVRVIDWLKAKDKHKPLLEMAAAIKQVSENVVKLNDVLNKTLKDAELKDSERARTAITLACHNFMNNVRKSCVSIIIHNNINANKDLIESNVYQIVSTEFYKAYNNLSAFQVHDVIVSSKLDEAWIDETAKDCLEIIYDGQDTIERIKQVSNKLDLTANAYSTHLNNKVFNH